MGLISPMSLPSGSATIAHRAPPEGVERRLPPRIAGRGQLGVTLVDGLPGRQPEPDGGRPGPSRGTRYRVIRTDGYTADAPDRCPIDPRRSGRPYRQALSIVDHGERRGSRKTPSVSRRRSPTRRTLAAAGQGCALRHRTASSVSRGGILSAEPGRPLGWCCAGREPHGGPAARL